MTPSDICCIMSLLKSLKSKVKSNDFKLYRLLTILLKSNQTLIWTYQNIG